MIPDITDKEEDLISLKKFIERINAEKFEFLPYHNLGKYKWKEFGVKYELEQTRVATNEDILRAKKIMEIT